MIDTLTKYKVRKSYLKSEVFNQAIAVAMASDAPKKMGAILLDKKNRVISAGVNSYERTHPVQYWAAKMQLKSSMNQVLKRKSSVTRR